MNKQGTDYKLAKHPSDYSACHRFLEKFWPEIPPLTFPTVMAEREGHLVGVLGTRKSNKAIIAGPFYVQVPGVASFVILRLIEVYENVLRNLGVSTFIFNVERAQTKWVKMLTGVGECTPYGETEDTLWFKRILRSA